MSEPSQRFEISCSCCGVLDYYAKLEDALEQARYFDEFPHKDCEDVMVYDRMAHIGRPDLYNTDGLARTIRHH